ncbi:MAG TPA: hypothetical protein VHC49_03765 [Mycobacteriales bacterium]|nr:hypothetical protein [Mycobacteriales bacterium]
MNPTRYLGALAFQVLESARRQGRDRGDVPGWVMVTLMSAILVVAILVPFRTQVVNAVGDAIDQVVGQGN